MQTHIAAIPEPQAEQPTILESFDLAKAVLEFSPTATPEIRAAALREIDVLAGRVKELLPVDPDGIDYCDALYEIVLDRRAAEPFREDRAEDYDLAQIAATRRGSCLAMGILVLSVARRIGAPFHGAQCTGHFFLKFAPGNAAAALNFDVTRPMPDHWRKLDEAYFRKTYRFDDHAQESGAYLRALTDQEVFSAFLASRAGFLALKKDFAAAQRDAAHALELNPRNVTAWVNAGFASEQAGHLDEAARQYDQALELDPRSVRVLNNLAHLHARNAQSPAYNTKQAQKLIRRALALQPRKAFLHATQGEIFAAQKQWREAARALQQAQKLEPRNVHYHERFLELRAYLRGEK